MQPSFPKTYNSGISFQHGHELEGITSVENSFRCAIDQSPGVRVSTFWVELLEGVCRVRGISATRTIVILVLFHYVYHIRITEEVGNVEARGGQLAILCSLVSTAAYVYHVLNDPGNGVVGVRRRARFTSERVEGTAWISLDRL